MIIHSSTKDYEIAIEKNLDFVEGLLQGENTFIVIDKLLYDLYKDRLFLNISEDRLYLVEALETNKIIDTALSICEVMTTLPAKRNAHLVSFGGGIIQDITGFAANILYRGIRWTFVPTTLLAACDSCIGGKTSLNYKKFKNLLGTFYPPDKIIICSEFFQTLSERDFESGLGEVVKFNVMYGEKGLARIEDSIDRLLNRQKDVLDEFVGSSLLFKKDFIEQDEFDKGIRIHLNFAHTFGHAFETVSDYAIPHGTAVAMGTVVANRISLSRNWLSEDIVKRIEAVLVKIIHVDLSGISLDMDSLLPAIRKDKKQIDNGLTAVLMKNDMELTVVHNVTEKEIAEALHDLAELIGQA